MAKAEDDEIVLQEVIIDRSNVQTPFVQRSESLQIPDSEGAKLSNLLQRSPKIAPKFPREKLKSMFRKRKLSSAFPFYKLKGVRFTKDTKDDDESLNRSLLDLRDEPVDVDITLSTPELTEVEKETGVHPYYFTQQAITSAKQLASGKAVTVRQSLLERSESQENKFKGQKMDRYLVRSNSLPNISHSDDYAKSVLYPVIESSLKKISEVMKNKEKMRKSKTKKKSPPPKRKQQSASSSSDVEELDVQTDIEPVPKKGQSDTEHSPKKVRSDSELPTKKAQSDTEPTSKKVQSDVESSPKKVKSDTVPPPKISILPQITVTRCDPKSSEPLDLEPSTSVLSKDRKCDQTTKETPSRRDSGEKTGKLKSSKTLQQSASEKSSIAEKTKAAPELHSTSSKPRKTSPPRTKFATDTKDHSKKSQFRKKSPPPHRPEKLTFAKPVPAKHIAGFELISEKEPISPTSDSDPSSPISIIPSTSLVGRTQTVPMSTRQSDRESSTSPKRSPTTDIPSPSFQYPRDTTITISDSVEDLSQAGDQTRPPLPPQRHIPRAGAKGKK